MSVRILSGMLESAGPTWFIRVLGCADTAASGPRPMEEGSTVPGFHVVAADAPGERSLAGRHYFSDYALIFRLDELSDSGTRLRAESRAVFPGRLGGAVGRWPNRGVRRLNPAMKCCGSRVRLHDSTRRTESSNLRLERMRRVMPASAAPMKGYEWTVTKMAS